MNKILLALSVIVLSSVAGMTGLEDRLGSVLCELITTMKNILPMVLLAGIVLSALIYGIGQLLPQELKARASSWALSGIVFIILAAILFLVVPYILDAIVPEWNILDVC
ncbi:MAG: hypothetical protein QW336_01875 [Candidatus Anstonellales archaeon]